MSGDTWSMSQYRTSRGPRSHARAALADAARVPFWLDQPDGGFISDPFKTTGLAHGRAMWPDELSTLVRLGRENHPDLASTVEARGIDADLRLYGKTRVAIEPQEVGERPPRRYSAVRRGRGAA